MNEVIALNMARWRKAAGLKQSQLGALLGWTNATVSAAERSADGKRVRQFTAAEVVRIATALGVPLIAMYLPPGGGGKEMAELFRQVLPDSLADTPAVNAYREALAAAARGYLDQDADAGLIAYLGEMAGGSSRAAWLGQRIDDLHSFEQDYRRRLIAYLEGQTEELRAGLED